MLVSVQWDLAKGDFRVAMATTSFPLRELNAKSAGIGTWVLMVHGVRRIEYEYLWQNKPRKGQKLECLLVATDGSYCQGVVKAQARSGGGVDPAVELKQMKEKFQDGTIWSMTKVTLADEKSTFIGAPLKICVDMRKTKCGAMLQGSVAMPVAPALEEELESILSLDRAQRVDLTALIAHISSARREITALGHKDITDITLVDGSKKKGAEELLKARMSMFFNAGEQGAALLKSMQEAHASKTPSALYGMTCAPQDGGTYELKTGQSFFWEVARGTSAKLGRLQAQATEMLAAPASLITKEWQPTQSARNFENEPAYHSVCGWLAALTRPPSNSGTTESTDQKAEGEDEVFQINHCHVAVPGSGDQVVTKDGSRIWLQHIRVMDATGSLQVSVREKAALALSGCISKAAFQEAHDTDNVSFPVLASIRVRLTKRKDDGSQSQEGGAREPTFLGAVVVEAEDQDIEKMPTQALLELRPILQKLALSTEELTIATLKDFNALPHVGMVVAGAKCALGLALVGATVKSDFQKCGEGYRLITKNVLDVGFGASGLKPEQCSALVETGFDLVAICTERNLTDYKMAPPRKTGAQYALVAISGVRQVLTGAGEPGGKVFMVERLQLVDGDENVVACQKMLAKLKYARNEFTFEGTKRDRSVWNQQAMTPTSSAKRVRRLSVSPSAASLPGEI